MNQQPGSWPLLTWARLIAILALVLLIAIVVFQNRESVETRILFSTITMPRAALLFVTFSIGLATGILGSWAFAARRKKQKS